MKVKHGTVRILLSIGAAVLAVICLVLALPRVCAGLVYLLRLFMPFVLAYVFALIVDPLVRRLQKHFKLPRNLTALLVIVLLIGVAGGIVVWAGYKVVNEIKSLYLHLPEIYESVLLEIEAIKERLWGLYEILPANIREALSELSLQFSAAAAEFINTKSVPFVTSAGSFAKALPKAFISTVVFLLAAFFMISDFERVKTVLKKPFREVTWGKFTRLSLQIKKYLGGYIKAQGTVMIVVFCVLFTSLSILDVQYALLIAMGTAFLDALPFFGSGAVLWPWSLTSFITGNLKMGISIIVIYVVILVVRQFIEPKIVSKNIGTTPLMTLISMYLGYRLLSVGGMILGPIFMMLIISLYRAGMFDAPVVFAIKGSAYLKNQYIKLKTRVKNIWESE